MAVTSMYSLWLEPPASLASTTSRFIKQHARNSNGKCPQFEPHVTLAGGFVGTDEEARAVSTDVVTALATTTGPLRCDAVEVTTGTRYHQCVYIRMNPTPSLAKAHEIAANAFGVEPGNGSGTLYMPHLSLVYGEVPEGERFLLAKEATDVLLGDTKDTSSASFTADTVTLWRTDTSDLTCESWTRVDRYPLKLACNQY